MGRYSTNGSIDKTRQFTLELPFNVSQSVTKNPGGFSDDLSVQYPIEGIVTHTCARCRPGVRADHHKRRH